MKVRKKYDTSNRPVLWREKIKKWMEDLGWTYECQCGCNKKYLLRNIHYYKGIPVYTRGHHPTLHIKNCINDEDVFWSRVNKTTDSGCWEWTEGLSTSGYGVYCLNNNRRQAHRVSWFYTYGVWPSKFVCHTCDNRKCVRPDHLFEGSQKDNMEDAAKKGRICKKFTKDTVLNILNMKRKGMSTIDVVTIVGCSQSFVNKIMSGEIWWHVTGIPQKSIKRKSPNGRRDSDKF